MRSHPHGLMPLEQGFPSRVLLLSGPHAFHFVEDVIRTALLDARTLILNSTAFRALRKQPSVSSVFCSSCKNKTEIIYGYISSSPVKGGMNVYYHLLNQRFHKKDYMRKSVLFPATRVIILVHILEGIPYIDSDHLFFC